MHAPTESKLISSDFLTNPSVSYADSSPKREPRGFTTAPKLLYSTLAPRKFPLILSFLFIPSVAIDDTFSLRLGHASALNVRRTFIHYRRAALLPCNKGRHEKFLLTSKFFTYNIPFFL